jgi:hypothetical protein
LGHEFPSQPWSLADHEMLSLRFNEFSDIEIPAAGFFPIVSVSIPGEVPHLP